MSEASGLRVHYFGNFEVIRDGEPIAAKAWPQRKTQSLLKILLHERGQIFTQDQLIDWLFPDQGLDVASRNLQKRVSELRKILEPELPRGTDSQYVQRLGQGYAFSAESACETDLELFTSSLRAAREHEEDGNWDSAREHYQSAIDLYRSEFLSEDRYEEWTLQAREHWAGQQLLALEHLAESHARLGGFETAIEHCRNVVAQDDCRESAARQLMIYYWKTGEQSKVSQVYQQVTEALADMDVEPSTETSQLFTKLQTGDTENLAQIYSSERTSRASLKNVLEKDREKGIAVLPFENMSADPENEYFSDGLTDELIHALARIEELQVSSRTSAFSLKGHSHSLQEIGDQLNVAHVVEGSVRKSGNRVRVVAQLIDTVEDSQLWSERYDFELEDIFAVQDEIAQKIAESLKGHLTEEQSELLTKHYTDNLDAYNIYLKGRYCWNQRSMEDIQQSIRHFEHAIELDPDYALAYSGLADSYNILSEYDWVSPQETLPKAHAAAEKALEIDPDLAEARASLGYALFYFEWDFAGAEREFKRSIELDPNYPVSRMWYSNFLMAMGRKDESLEQIYYAQSVEPLSSLYNACVASMCYFARDYDQSIETGRSILEREPNYGLANIFLMWSYEQKDMFLDAIREGERAQELMDSPQIMAYLGHTHGASGKPDEALKIIERLNELSSDQYVSPFCMALIYAGLDDHDVTFEWLDKSFEERSFDLVYINVWPVWDHLRDDPRFEDLLTRIGLS